MVIISPRGPNQQNDIEEELMINNRPGSRASRSSQYQQIVNLIRQENLIEAHGLRQFNEMLNVRQRNKVRIKTNVMKRDVLFRENYPLDKTEQAIFKYACPICLMYFNTVLVSTCCSNYIFRFCIGDLAKKAKKDANFVIRCTHCMEEDFKLFDVDPNA